MSKNLISNFSNFESKLAEIKFKCNDPKTEAKIAIGLISEFLDCKSSAKSGHLRPKI